MRLKEKITHVIDTLFGWGTLSTLFCGGLTAMGFLLALILGGEVGESIAVFVHKRAFPLLIYAVSLITLLGLAGMYLRGEKRLAMDSEKTADK